MGDTGSRRLQILCERCGGNNRHPHGVHQKGVCDFDGADCGYGDFLERLVL